MFKDLVVMVTGGAQGIGKGITLAYAQQGAKVVIADLNAGLGSTVRTGYACSRLLCIICSNGCDKGTGYHSFDARAVEQYGTIHILINNAGKFQHQSPTR